VTIPTKRRSHELQVVPMPREGGLREVRATDQAIRAGKEVHGDCRQHHPVA
jgi:hypothetical protein